MMLVTSSWPEFATFLFSIAGATIGGSLVAWLSGYYSEKGKRKLIQEEFPRVLEQARQNSYEQEKGKNLATKEDIQQVIDQVRAVTRETEIIKAEIGGGLWREQMLWGQKRDMYVEAMAVMSKLVGCYAGLAANIQNGRGAEATSIRAEIDNLESELTRVSAIAHIVANKGCINAFRIYARQVAEYHPVLDAEWALWRSDEAARLFAGLVVAAKVDLGQ